MRKSLTFGHLTTAALFAIAALFISISTAFAAAPNWDTTGSYEVAFTCTTGCSGTYNHDLTLAQDGSGNLTGSGGSPVGAHVYNWTLTSGTVDADSIAFSANYTSTPDAVTPQTTMNVAGTIVGGSMSGTWTDNYQGAARSGTWTTVSGTADPIVATPPTATTVVVSDDTSAGENQDGWLFNRDTSTETPYSFEEGNASIGTGSLFIPAITNTIDGNSDKFVGELFLLDPLADINSISYDFKIASTGEMADKDHFYMNVYANFGESAPTKFYDCRYNVVPTTGVVDGYTTVTFDPTQSYPVTTSGTSPHTCPASPSGMDALDVGSSSIRMIALNVGDTSGSDTGVSGYYDKVVVSTDSSITTYDFEPVPADTTAPAAPTHISPADGTVTTTAAQNLIDWSDVTDPSAPVVYYYEVSNSSSTDGSGAFTAPIYQSGALASSEIPTPGTPEGTYYWHVRAVDNNGNTSPWTTAWKVTISNTPPTPTVPPANACATPGTAPAGYTLQKGTAGNDTVTLAPNTMFVGKGGNDKVSGGDGNYIVCTAGGNDTITLGNGNSTIDAGGGNNAVTVGHGEGAIKTGAGNDTVVVGNGARTISVGNGNNKVTSGDGVQTITAGSGNDEIRAGGGDDTVNAGGGNNKVWGEAGADMLTSAAGNDKLDGGADTDTCSAGGGNNIKTSCEL